MQADTISDISHKIFKYFTQEAERLGKENNFKIRSSKLSPSAFIKGLVSCCLSGHFSLELFCSALRKEKVKITKQALFERYNERTANFLKSLGTLALRYFKTEKLPQLAILNQFTALNLIDS